MKWKKYTIKTTTQAEDILSAALAEIGIWGVQIEDNVPLSEEDRKKLYIDFLPELAPDDGVAYVSFFLDSEEDQQEILTAVQEELQSLRAFMDIGEGTITTDETEDKDWINNWKQYFKSFSIVDIFIKPTWEEAPAEEGYSCIIEIDPGTSFGTGKHETTQLAIRQLRKYLKPGDQVLDVGCGSGILSIISLKLGAGHVVGTDVDPECMSSTRENMEGNHLPAEAGCFYQGNLIDDTNLQQQVGCECFDIVVANILADVIIPMTPVIPKRLKAGGIYITSGIIDFKEEAVKEAIAAAGFELLEIGRQGEWVSVTARKQ